MICQWARRRKKININPPYFAKKQLTYATCFAGEPARINARHFVQLDIAKNRELRASGKQGDRLPAFNTTKTLWGCERRVVVTFHPTTTRKKPCYLTRKFERLRTELIEYRRRFNRRHDLTVIYHEGEGLFQCSG